jgi:hypothetical protein
MVIKTSAKGMTAGISGFFATGFGRKTSNQALKTLHFFKRGQK